MRWATGVLAIAACSGKPASSADAASRDGSIDGSIDSAVITQACDTLAQDCPNAGDKCTVVAGTSGNQRGCVAVTGAGTAGQACTRDAGGLGYDDCAAGLFCTFMNVVPPDAGGTRYCRKLCHHDTDCAADEKCPALDALSPADGVCSKTCLPFDDCGPQMSCADLWQDAGTSAPLLVCRVAGATAIGATCATNYECVADSICFDPTFGPNPRCTALCDASHACAAGTCHAILGSAGYCN